jgi:hypothetical protein
VLLAVAALGQASPASAEDAKRCKGGKELYQGRCLYPDEVQKLKVDAERKRAADAERKKAEQERKEAGERAQHDAQACSKAREADTATGWEEYSKAFPDGSCDKEATARIAALKAQQAPPPPPPPPPPAPTEPPEPGPGVSPLVWIGFGVAAAGFITWGVAGGIAIGRESALAEDCPDKVCPADKQGDLDNAMTAAHVSTVGMVFGFAGAAVGVVGLLLPLFEAKPATEPAAPDKGAPQLELEPLISLGAVGLGGRF